jgi:glycosyltransferase involved in cell wall biosynthesis
VITLLRPSRESELLLTAEAFESLFRKHLGTAFGVRRPPLEAWCDAVLGPPDAPFPPDERGRRLAGETRGAHFLCPNYELIPFAPLLLEARNRARAPVRLLFISHASGSYGLEWALLAPLLAPGDRIVAPSHSARRAIELLCPALSPFIRVIHHPMEPLPVPAGTAERGDRVVSLGRIQAQKLLHRQIDAMAILRGRGRPLPTMEMAGALEDGGWTGGEHPYVRGLRERIRRHGLERHVRLVGAVRGDRARGEFLAGARMMVNLSVTVEESFPKAPVEALGVGVPVLATAWDGLHESVGPGGELLPLHLGGVGAGLVDVSAEAVADGMERLLDAPPPPALCRAHADRYRPEVSVPLYRAVLEEALAEAGPGFPVPDAPPADLPAAAGGVLANSAPLTAFSWRELFELYAASCTRVRTSWRTGSLAPTAGDFVRTLLADAVTPPLSRLYAGLPPLTPPSSTDKAVDEEPAAVPASDFFGRLALAARLPGLAPGRMVCLATVAQAKRADLLAGPLARLEADGADTTMLRAEAEAQAGDFQAAFLRVSAALRAAPAGENEELRIRQAARIARQWGRPELAIPFLAEWLERFPDSQESGPVWLELSLNRHRAGGAHAADAAAALERARTLLGDIPAVGKMAGMISRGAAAEVLA